MSRLKNMGGMRVQKTKMERFMEKKEKIAEFIHRIRNLYTKAT